MTSHSADVEVDPDAEIKHQVEVVQEHEHEQENAKAAAHGDVEGSKSAPNEQNDENQGGGDNHDDADDDVWLFGYGSLIWKPDIEYEEQVDVYASGYSRRFWQGSPEHRGTEEAPGLVVTLLTPEEHQKVQDDHNVEKGQRDTPDNRVWGRIFRVKGHIMRATMAALEHREKAGYAKEYVQTTDPAGVVRTALVFRATPDNEHFFGPRPEEAIAKHIASSEGESGHNLEYFLRMYEALCLVQKEFPEHHDIVDDHLRKVHANLPENAR
ncbi:Glutathione-specific gamma-glutamylcyclotransferase 1 [Hondaea fermentalgiana]|uniref:glutathione-specific gamma-glutamylcyclotransferase n=1 Tax=Hondaea fermentalgiana TaxID=2315210 RepID=A0A2R5G9A5_9STRA|nr:Glutathione-specific gamma-glutamylcyclotransferase 1 [Hondaea fermentalgiana]|eukprot:GBG25053.1 Glutathione-specific gamma-glutamylcyclotransferase 1 [Hondaea fermentalgiana]